MESIHTHFIRIQEQITQAEKESSRPPHAVRLMAASKQQPIDIIEEAINAGMNLFGENKVQEAQAKWPALKEKHPHIQCHLIGHLQSNKCDEAVALFDCIHSLDSIKLAECLKKSMTKQNKEVPCFIQVNIGEEPQKDGVLPAELPALMQACQALALPIIGLMCIPPENEHPDLYFALLKKLADRYQLNQLSMGMSHDFNTAIRFGATIIRVGTALFGKRETLV
ncbi:MAG: YggS family pyridoxal phosphate-dependent enzyme [Alphaproteobacteria bacterium]|nr:YggS family pyridoxal phosphate-dependent enzyme [Alphaproteobacteria bacterium]